MSLTRRKDAVSVPTAFILTIPMLGILYFFIIKPFNGLLTVSSWMYFIFTASLYILMVFTGKTAVYRRIFFVIFALLFFPTFIMNLIEARGSMGLSETDIINTETPFCHIVIPITLFHAVVNKTIIFPARMTGHYASVYSMLSIWLVASLILGRGWCSWGCFYGGWDDGSSRLSRKKYVNIDSPSDSLRYFNYAMLMFLVLVSLVTVSSVYC